MRLRVARKVLYARMLGSHARRIGTVARARARWLKAWRPWRARNLGPAMVRKNGKFRMARPEEVGG